jgi:hypothetical protein
MKTIYHAIVLLSVIMLCSCATNAKFSVSPITPAAEGTAKITKDRNKNYVIEVTVKYLANPDRLTPPREQYVVWMTTDKANPINIGMLKSGSNNKAYLRTTSSSKPTQIFVTAETVGDGTWPGKEEIFHTDHLNMR